MLIDNENAWDFKPKLGAEPCDHGSFPTQKEVSEGYRCYFKMGLFLVLYALHLIMSGCSV